MYKGNMGDFCEKANNFLLEKYNCSIHFHTWRDRSFVAFFGPFDSGAEGYEVFDNEDFEKEMYEFINKKLEEKCIKVI